MFRTSVLLAAGAAGCQVVFTLEDPIVIKRITVEVHLLALANDPAGLPVPSNLPYSPETVVVELADGSLPAVVQTADGVYEFDTPSLAYTVTVDDPLGTVVVDHDVEKLQIPLQQLGRTGTAVQSPPTITVNATGGPAITSQLIQSTGVWSFGGNPVSWGGPGHTIFGPRVLFDSDANDQMFWTGYQRVDQLETIERDALVSVGRVPPLTLMQGTPQVLTVTADAPPALCATFSAARADELARIANVAPASFELPKALLVIEAIPALELGPTPALVLAAAESGKNLSPTEMQYAQPFPGAKAVPSLFAVRERVLIEDPTEPLKLAYATKVFAPPIPETSECTGATVDLQAAAVALIDSIAVDDMPLTSDDLVVAIGDRVTISWDVTPQPVDLFVVKVFELVVQGTKGSLKPIAQRLTTERSAELDGALFVPGTDYVIAVDGRIGTPNAATGDLVTTEFPHGGSTATSFVFGVSR